MTLLENRFHHVKLGDLYYEEGPQSIHYWHGTISDCEQGFDIILNTSNLNVADVDFIAVIIRDWKYYEEKALEYIRMKLAKQPKIFQLSKEDRENTAKLKKMPFYRPQFIFYEKQEWMLIFLENELGIGGQYDVSVDFNGETPTDACDLSDSEEIEDE